MDNTTDKGEVVEGPMNEDQVADWLLTPEQSEEPEAETDEAPAEPTEPEEPEAEDDAPDEAEEYEGDDDEADEAEADDDDGDPEEDEDEPAEQLFTVSVDGTERQVSLDELKRGYSGQQKIQADMEANANARKQLQAAAQSMQQERQALLQMYERAHATGFMPAPQEPSPDLLKTDPIAYMEAEAKYRGDLKEYQKQQAQMRATYERQQQYETALRQQQTQEQAQRLLQMAPEFGDAKKAPELVKRIVDGATSEYGLSKAELDEIGDARALVILRDALEYRKIQKGKTAARKEKEPATAVTRPSGKRRDGGKKARAQKAMQKAMRTQSTDDWVNVLLSPDP